MRRGNATTRLAAFVALAAVLCALPLLSACDEKGRTDYFETAEVGAYLYSVEEADGMLVARFTVQETANVYATAPCHVEETYAPDGAFHNRRSLGVLLSAGAARAAVDEYVGREGSADVPAGGLKIFLDYVTIDGRTTSDGETGVSDGNYVHTATENEEGDLSLNLTTRYPYYTAWYAVAASSAVAAMVVAAVAVVCAKVLKARKG